MIYVLGFNQIDYMFALILLIKIVLCSKFIRPRLSSMSVPICDLYCTPLGAENCLVNGRDRMHRASSLHARPFEPSIKSHFSKISSTFGDKCPRNGSKNEEMAPRTRTGYPHKGPSVVLKHGWRQAGGCEESVRPPDFTRNVFHFEKLLAMKFTTQPDFD